MSTYNDQLQAKIISQLASLSTNQTQLETLLAAAQLKVYYAQGGELAARDKLANTFDQFAYCSHMSDQCQYNDNQAQNVLTTVGAAQSEVATSLTNAATAAANVASAFKSIKDLADDLTLALSGAKLSFSTTKPWENEIYAKIEQAQSCIAKVARQSNDISLLAIQASSKSSEITASVTQTQAQATTVKAKIDALLSSTYTDYDALTSSIITDNKAVTQVFNVRQQTEGMKREAKHQVDAYITAYKNANKLNQDLEVKVISGHEIDVSFSEIPPILIDGSAVSPAVPDPKYFLALVPESSAEVFTVDAANQLFARRAEGDNSQFHTVSPNVKIDSQRVRLSVDAYNQKIEVGTRYVAFIYRELSMAYKRFMNSFADQLSAPSKSFIPATELPRAKELSSAVELELKTLLKFEKNEKPEGLEKLEKNVRKLNPMALFFKADIPPHLTHPHLSHLEFRCILVEEKRVPNLNFWYSGNSSDSKEFQVFFDLKIALQVPPSNYIVATNTKEYIAKHPEIAGHSEFKDYIAKHPEIANLHEIKDYIAKHPEIARHLAAKDHIAKNTAIAQDDLESDQANAVATKTASARTKAESTQVKAEPTLVKAESAPAADTALTKTFIVELGETPTDSFGNQCSEIRKYYPVILALVTGENGNKYINNFAVLEQLHIRA